MASFYTSFFAPFLAFLSAHILSPYVNFWIKRWQRTQTAKLENDVELAREATRLMSRQQLYKITEDIFSGETTFVALRRLDRVIDFQQFSEFDDKQVNTKLVEAASAIKRLREYTQAHYDGVDGMTRVRFHRPTEAEGGHEKYLRILKERETLVSDADKSVMMFHRVVAQRLPQARNGNRKLRP